MLLAAEEAPAFLGPVVALLVAAGVVGYICVRMRVVPIVGFLLAGVLIGPHQLGLVADEESVHAAADIGVMLLLFTIGIEFSLERLASIKRYVLVGGGVQVSLTIAVVTGLLLLFGIDWRVGVFTGFLVALSSTAIVLKVLSAKGMTNEPVGQTSVGALILQDLAIIVMVLLVPLLAGVDGASSPLDIVRALGTAALVLGGVLVVQRKVIPPLLERVAKLCSPEVFLLTVVAIALGTAWLTSSLGVSDALGAFLAGLVLSESRHSAHALGEIMPLQIVFSAVFFVSIGMLLDWRVLVESWWLVLILAAAVVGIKLATSYTALAVLRVGAPTALASTFLLAQIGEFSFVIQRAGAEQGLFPAGLGEQGSQLLIAVTVLLMTLTPAMSALGDRLGRTAREHGWGVPGSGDPAADGPRTTQKPAADQVLVAGWGRVARGLAAVLRARGIPVTVTTLSPVLAAEAEAEGHHVVRGDVTKASVLHEAGIDHTRLVVITENSGEETTHIAEILHQIAPGVSIVARPVDITDVEGLSHAEVTYVVDTARSVVEPLSRSVLAVLAEEPAPDDAAVPFRVLRFSADPDSACQHTGSIRPVLPKSTGCVGCRREGRDDWVHLRVCLSCGYVGCCDSSPRRHAAGHFTDTDHPIAAAAEPGENWAWCFHDQVRIEPQHRHSPHPTE